MGYETDYKWNGSAAISGTCEAPCSGLQITFTIRGYAGHSTAQFAKLMRESADMIERGVSCGSFGGTQISGEWGGPNAESEVSE